MLLNIQYLRAFAVLNVAFFHVIMISESYGQKPDNLYFLVDWGQNGVDIFFVISGFIMVYIQNKNPRSPIDFIKNRIFRIVPLYWFVTLSVALLFFLLPDIFRSFTPDLNQIIPTLLFISQLSMGEAPLISVGWTLEYEIFFYFLFSLTLFYKNQFGSKLILIALLIYSSALGYYDYIVLEFILGMLAAGVFLKFPCFSYRYPVFVLGLCLLLLSIVYKPDYHRALVWGVPAMLLVISIAYFPEKLVSLWKVLGDASYSIYLIHSFVISLFYKVSSSYFGLLNNDLLSVVSLLLSIFSGVMMYVVIEKPMTKLIISLRKNAHDKI
jgi:exopolysaccharide production protein ExoZ